MNIKIHIKTKGDELKLNHKTVMLKDRLLRYNNMIFNIIKSLTYSYLTWINFHTTYAFGWCEEGRTKTYLLLKGREEVNYMDVHFFNPLDDDAPLVLKSWLKFENKSTGKGLMPKKFDLIFVPVHSNWSKTPKVKSSSWSNGGDLRVKIMKLRGNHGVGVIKIW